MSARRWRFALIHVDGTEKPEAPQVTLVSSQALQYSALNWLALDAQMQAVRALEYACRVPAAEIALSDRETRADFRFRLGSRRARLLLHDRHSKTLLASFGND
ncbi:MAG TPA: hypothetical protein VJX29_03870 [Candidatus Acidoferrales bacterium]|nr:hypothetical protein [Candidatus Acidoferrales bacterium]